ncbi:MAG: Glu-tRNA(Gln) amidotransferase subunit GatE [Candidatus Woesearchaeota archaeon]|nr:Glu-tRNA(Gln) amidotransferase subunit GatE [Candidatus Woesearchaeota archaeon]
MIDYKKLDFKCGLEIHKQLETHKLFCNCPSFVNDPNKPDIIINRKLRSVAGETGTLDIAAEYEKSKNKNFVYEACSTSSCLVELDEEPPHPINQHAIDIALEIALLLNAKIVDEIQIMRKTVIDGSNTSGFQRTSLIALNGYIETSKGRVLIPEIYLEEEAAKKIKEDEKTIIYRLDRLGVPLVEIKTDSSIKDPEHAKETAALIGMILKSTGKVKSGLGTIRQDVNISIMNKARTEIKGFQDLRSIPKVIENEVKRQLSIIERNEELKNEVRKAEDNFTTTFLRPMPGSSRLYPETDVPFVIITKERISKIKLPELITIKAMKLEEMYNLPAQLARELINNKTFEKFVNKYTIEPSLIAHILIDIPKEIKKRNNLDPKKLKEQDFEFILDNLNKNIISKEAIIDILSEIIQNKKIDINKYKLISIDNIEQEVKDMVQKNKGASFNALMGIIMEKYHGKIDGKKASELVKKYIS